MPASPQHWRKSSDVLMRILLLSRMRFVKLFLVLRMSASRLLLQRCPYISRKDHPTYAKCRIYFRHHDAARTRLNQRPVCDAWAFFVLSAHRIEKLGGFRYGHQTEDMEMALRIQQAGYRIENSPHARVYTKTPNTLSGLIKQRTRWTTGFLRNVTENIAVLSAIADKRARHSRDPLRAHCHHEQHSSLLARTLYVFKKYTRRI